MITASTDFVLYEGSKTKFVCTACMVDYKYNGISQTYLCEIMPAVVSTTTSTLGSYTYLITKADVDAKTGTGTNPSDKLQNQIDQVIKDYLHGITENGSVTFTI
jgi:hypothetical protein